MSEFISGIYNYCDRWCERCRFIERCHVGVEEMEFWEKEKLVKTPEERQKLVLDSITDSFKDVQDLLSKISAEQGIDLDAILAKPDPDYDARQQKIKEFREENETIKLGMKYAVDFRNWRKEKLAEAFDPDEFVQAHALGIKSEKAIREDLAEIEDQLAIIRFYSSMIAVKIGRAMRGQFEDNIDGDDDLNDVQSDHNGTAKLSVIMINRSIIAWIKLMELLPALKDDAITHLAILQKLQRDMQETFPLAEQFVRPGFDTGEEP